jgi:hypothetical protein
LDFWFEKMPSVNPGLELAEGAGAAGWWSLQNLLSRDMTKPLHGLPVVVVAVQIVPWD